MRTLLFAAGAFACAILPAAAQSLIAARAGLISYSEGEVFLNGTAIHPSPAQWPRMRDNDLIRSATGRAELLLNPCVALHIDRNSSLRLLAGPLTGTRVELLDGSAIVQDDGASRGAKVTVLVKGFAVPLTRSGTYRFEVEPPRLKVFAGKALVGAGHSIALDDPGRASRKFDPRQTDAFDLWSAARVAALAKAVPSNSESETAAARRTALQQAQTRNPNSIDYDPAGPPPPPASPVPFGTASGRARVCSASPR